MESNQNTGNSKDDSQNTKLRDVKYGIEFPEMTIDELANDVLSIDIKHDYESKLITCLCFLSAYTYDSQLNVSFNAPSSSGKTYITTAIASLFPDEDKIALTRASPTALFYKEGDIDKVTGARIVSLERKILIFYEVPGPHMQMTLRSILSHDQWESKALITNKDQKGANRAQEVILRGFPSTIFCSAKLTFDEQEATRAILLSPEESEAKTKDSIHFTAQRSSGNKSLIKMRQDNPVRKNFMARIRAIRDEHVDDVYISNSDEVEQRFIKLVGVLRNRHNRDIDHLYKLIKSIALLNLWRRRRKDGTIVANESDIDQAFKLWAIIAESQNQDVPPVVLRVYKDIILPAWDAKKANPEYGWEMDQETIGLTRQEICAYHLKHRRYKLRDDYLRKEIIPQLEASGMVSQLKPLNGDKRSMHIIPRWFPGSQNNIGEDGRSEAANEKLELSDP